MGGGESKLRVREVGEGGISTETIKFDWALAVKADHRGLTREAAVPFLTGLARSMNVDVPQMYVRAIIDSCAKGPQSSEVIFGISRSLVRRA